MKVMGTKSGEDSRDNLKDQLKEEKAQMVVDKTRESGMDWMCAQTKPWFILSSERVLGEWSQNPC